MIDDFLLVFLSMSLLTGHMNSFTQHVNVYKLQSLAVAVSALKVVTLFDTECFCRCLKTLPFTISEDKSLNSISLILAEVMLLTQVFSKGLVHIHTHLGAPANSCCSAVSFSCSWFKHFWLQRQ